MVLGLISAITMRHIERDLSEPEISGVAGHTTARWVCDRPEAKEAAQGPSGRHRGR
ncbi:hypothetical protein KI387_028410, partial [Taxus chinensis]